MRNIPNWPTDTDALEPIVRVVHGGKDREVDGLSLSRELPSSFHAQVKGVGGLTQATGNLTWSALADVTEVRHTAFNRTGGWPPKIRDRVDVYTGYRTASGDLLAKQITAAVSGVSGDPQEATRSNLVDLIARLSRTVNLPPLITNMPPIFDGGPWRGIGLYPMFFTDRAARAGSFNSTPGAASGCVMSAPLMGAAWPERGTIYTGLRFTDRNNAAARWHVSPWGMAVSDAYLSYAAVGNSALTRPMEITAMAPAAPYLGRTYVAAQWGDSEIRLNFNNSHIYGMVNGAVVCEMPYSEGHVFSLRVVPGVSTVTLTVRDAEGREASGTAAKPAGTSVNMSEVLVVSEVPNAMIGGAQIAFPSTAWSSVNYTRSAFLTPGAHYAPLTASPPLQNIPARDLLEDQAEAELAAVWIDGDGYLRWVSRNYLLSPAPVAILTSKEHLKSLSWKEDFAAVSSQVEVKSRKPTVQQSKFNMVSMWEASQSNVEPGDTFEWLIHPDTDEDWIMPDLSVETLGVGTGDNEGFRRFNRGMDSWLALYGENEVQGTNSWYASPASAAFIDYKTYRVAAYISTQNTSHPDWSYSIKVPSETVTGFAAGPMRHQPGLGTPVIRGRGKIMWEDATYTADSGVWDAPVLTHDVGWWVQDPGACQTIADLLASQTTTPRPYLSGVSIVPDARLERGDIVTLSDPDQTGIEFRCLVVGIEDSFSSEPTRWEQSCDFRVLDYAVISATLGDLDTAWSGQLLTALDAARANETLSQFDRTPLKGAPQ